MQPSPEAPRGFVLAELVVVLVVSTIVVSALLTGMVALVRALQPQQVVLEGEPVPVAPTFAAFPAAVRLHQIFGDHVATARAVYVFGGRHLSIPANAPAASVGPLAAASLPVIPNFSAGLPLDAQSFYDAYATALGPQRVDGSAEDFSILTIGTVAGATAVTCLVQVRRVDVPVSDGVVTTTFRKREVTLREHGAADPQRYAFAEPASFPGAGFVGAVHTWMRHGGRDGLNEEGPACVVFPDPWLHAGARGRVDDIPAFSRFSYLLALSP